MKIHPNHEYAFFRADESTSYKIYGAYIYTGYMPRIWFPNGKKDPCKTTDIDIYGELILRANLFELLL